MPCANRVRTVQLVVVGKLLCEVAGHLAENLEVCLTIHDGHLVYGVIHLVILLAVDVNDLIVVRKFLDQSSRRRNDHCVLAVGTLHEEYAVIVEILYGCIRVTLYESDGVGLCVSSIGTFGIEGDVGILPCYRGVVRRDDGILLGDQPGVLVDGPEGGVDIVVICEAAYTVCYVDDIRYENITERRA